MFDKVLAYIDRDVESLALLKSVIVDLAQVKCDGILDVSYVTCGTPMLYIKVCTRKAFRAVRSHYKGRVSGFRFNWIHRDGDEMHSYTIDNGLFSLQIAFAPTDMDGCELRQVGVEETPVMRWVCGMKNEQENS